VVGGHFLAGILGGLTKLTAHPRHVPALGIHAIGATSR
jgi:hypothetical protein